VCGEVEDDKTENCFFIQKAGEFSFFSPLTHKNRIVSLGFKCFFPNHPKPSVVRYYKMTNFIYAEKYTLLGTTRNNQAEGEKWHIKLSGKKSEDMDPMPTYMTRSEIQ